MGFSPAVDPLPTAHSRLLPGFAHRAVATCVLGFFNTPL